MTNALLDVHAVTAGFAGRPVLHSISLAVWRSEVVLLVGHNGVG